MPAQPDSADQVIDAARVTLHPALLFDAWIVGLEGDEFYQVREVMEDEHNGRCVWGVLRTVMRRAGMSDPEQLAFMQTMGPIERRAGQLVGSDCIEGANDGGVSFAELAAALRSAHATMCDQG